MESQTDMLSEGATQKEPFDWLEMQNCCLEMAISLFEAKEGREILAAAAHPSVIPAPTMQEAAALAVASARSAA